MNSPFLSRIVAILGLIVIAAITSSCTTYYDSYGYPRQTVDPGLAVAGAVAAGALGYALADSRDHRHNRGRDYRYHRRSSRHHDHYHQPRRHSYYRY